MLVHRKDDSNGLLILINVLEFIAVIINYCASLHSITRTKIKDDPHLILLNITNNASALSWTNHTYRKKNQDWPLICLLFLLTAHQLTTEHKFPMDQHR